MTGTENRSMKYRRLGATGLKLSELSFGSWVTFQKQLDDSLVIECMRTAYDAGVNFFDTAEVYAKGQAEQLMGNALRKLGWRRGSYVVSTKYYWGLHDNPNEWRTLNRKYLIQALDDSLRRLQLDYVDIVYCHRADPDTPIEETVWAMSDLIDRGRALYWGTSEWSAAQIEEAFQAADRLGLRMPVVEQPEYNLLQRERVENEYAPLYAKRRLGTTTWSPLASGLLTGKYSEKNAKGGRLNMAGFEWLKEKVYTERNLAIAKEVAGIAREIDCTPAQLAIAWCLLNPNVSSVITGASRAEQVVENLRAIEVVSKLDDGVKARVSAALSK